MVDLEVVLVDVSYLMVMEKSKFILVVCVSKKIILFDFRYKLFGDFSMYS